MSDYAIVIESFEIGQAKRELFAMAGFHTILADSDEMVGI